ncbi:hypothetical protein Naga_100775g1 [Nannochloropsis gaditana]|uniref:Uncharacterized protein n=1 Tax=Nannochloropsis gaditana TaxID=72520 RepID=W7TDS9_9STRA|nr:hypothetical protein Naga_100775g1 [Nannochloropsis gaditana]
MGHHRPCPRYPQSQGNHSPSPAVAEESAGSGGRDRHHSYASYSPTAAVLRGVADKVQRFGEGVRNSTLSRNFSSNKLHKDGADAREREGGRESSTSRADRRDSSNVHPGSTSSLNALPSLDSHHHKHHKGVQEFGVIGEELYSRMDIEAFLMIVRGFQPAEPATTSTSSVKLERPTALRAAAAAAVASSKTVPPALGLGGGGGGLEGGREGGREAGSSLPPLSKATFQPPSPMPTALSVKIRSVVASEEGKAGGGKEESKGTGAAGDPETVLARRRREEDGETEDRRRPGGMRDGINGAGHEGRL